MHKTLALLMLLLLSAPVARADTPKVAPKAAARPSELDTHKALIRRFYEEVWNKGQLDVADEVFAKEYVRHDAGGGPPTAGPEGQKQIAAGTRKAFPDLVMTIDLLIGEGDTVIARWTIQGTNTGDLPTTKATGKKVTFSGVNIFRFEHDKVVELWNHRDDLSMMVQLGVVQLPKPAQPTPAPTKPASTKPAPTKPASTKPATPKP